MSHSDLRTVLFKFQLSDLTLWSVGLPLQVRAEKLSSEAPLSPALAVPEHELLEGSEGFAIRGLPLAQMLAPISRLGRFLCYASEQYQHYYIDLELGFERYEAKFSSKTRATIQRKMRKFAERCGGELRWQTYRSAAEVDAFMSLALPLSKRTYQDRLLDAGLPDSKSFHARMRELAERDEVRGYILFDGERPVSYLLCPSDQGVLSYSYQGYDPEYMRLSVGTVLQWLALEQIFKESRFRYFDFTEGESDHKRLFATNHRLCANVFFVRRTLTNSLLLHGHRGMNLFSSWLGDVVEKVGLKARIKRVLRFGRGVQA